MRRFTLRCFSCFQFALLILVPDASAQSVAFEHFPLNPNRMAVCWSVPRGAAGSVSQIAIFDTDDRDRSKQLWQSAVEEANSPRIRFVEEFSIEGAAVVLVERQLGAAVSRIEAIAAVHGRFRLVSRVEGSEFEVKRIRGGEQPLLIAHHGESYVDVPRICGWTNGGFKDISNSYPEYYAELLSKEEKHLLPDTSAVALFQLAQLARLSANSERARLILQDALARERKNGASADADTIKQISAALSELRGKPR